jgi:hypothetical protein
MPYIHWVPRQNKLEIPNDKEEVNTREIHKCDGQTHDPDTMVVPLKPKPTRKAEALTKAPSTIVSRREEDVELKKWPKPWLCCANGILETKATPLHNVVYYKSPLPHHFFLFFFSFVVRTNEREGELPGGGGSEK